MELVEEQKLVLQELDINMNNIACMKMNNIMRALTLILILLINSTIKAQTKQDIQQIEELKMKNIQLDQDIQDIENEIDILYSKITILLNEKIDNEIVLTNLDPNSYGHIYGDPNSKNRSSSDLGNSGSGFNLKGRAIVGPFISPTYNIQEEGIVKIKIRVDKKGNVTSAEYKLNGSTTQNNYLKQKAIEAAKKTKFNADEMADAYQEGTLIYHFVLD